MDNKKSFIEGIWLLKNNLKKLKKLYLIVI